ncbi:MAG: hypothetical protein P4N59_15950 [Negativicutes bacterium]|nr:hypothetical protein [Negativicutes bacterium]
MTMLPVTPFFGMLVGSVVAETGVYPTGMHQTVNWSASGTEVAVGGGVVGVAGGMVGATVGLGGKLVGAAVGSAAGAMLVAAGAMLVAAGGTLVAAAGAAVGVLLEAQADVKRTGRTINANKMSLAALLLNIFSSLVFLLE